jgi:hypothetical protein
MAAMSSEGDGVIYSIALVESCTGEAKTLDLKCTFLFVTPLQKMNAPNNGTPACTPHTFVILVSRQGMIHGQTSRGGKL